MNLLKKNIFKDKPNTAVLTCTHILNENRPILYVSHDFEDGCWQFLCGQEHKTEDAKIMALEEIYNMDKSLKEIANLDYGESAIRKDLTSKWVIKYNKKY